MSRTRTTIIIAGALAIGATSSFAEPHKKKAAPVPAPLIAQACAGCHGQLGKGQNGTPVLAGYEKDNFGRVWDEFRNNQRPAATIMPRIARGYTDVEITTLADYFSSLHR
jgi:sulfide dehydrogenase cytochrome subunit